MRKGHDSGVHRSGRRWGIVVAVVGLGVGRAEERPWPRLPERDGIVEIPAQEWSRRPGPRSVRVGVHFPGGSRAGVGPRTGVFLTLHNWGGTDVVGTADPGSLAREFDVVAVGVNYLQSGRADGIEGREAYDFGWLQALDALRALWWVGTELDAAGVGHAKGRVFATGGSGGGNVALMANKLAPRTFAVVVDLCGMKKLSDDIAYGLPGRTTLNARWSRDPASPDFLSAGAQEIRFVGHPVHLAEMKALGNTTKVVTVHGVEDASCPFADAAELARNFQAAGLDIVPRWITRDQVDGTVFTNAGHALGDRTRIVSHVAGAWLRPDGPDAQERKGASDFERREVVRYPTRDGVWVIDYSTGRPVGRWEPLATRAVSP